ncbi:MAG TPA: hypothetical protein VHF00_07505 [Acidimicrobiales bacterium]|jgi:hypothetical protein|nr:hypothetical protein [Acidimicrobiales bacterium]
MSTGLLHVAASPTAPGPAAEQLTIAVRPWPDGVIDALGHDPRSSYVEQFWLGILGPSTTWLLRRLAAGLDASPAGFDLPLADTARALGLGSKGGRHSPFMRALGRCCQFGLAEARGDRVLAVRRKLPPLNRRQLLRLPPPLQAAHEEWQKQQLRAPAAEQLRRRCRRLALSLVELGEDLEATERQLERWKFHPTLSQEAAQWAWDRHRRALAAAQGVDLEPDGDDAA